MAEETQAPAAAPEEVAAVSDVPQAEETKSKEKDQPTPLETEESETEKPKETTKTEEETSISQSVSFKEESNRVSDLEDPEKKALEELKILIQQALNNHEFIPPPPPPQPIKEEKPEEEKPTTTIEEEKKPSVVSSETTCEEPSKIESEEKKPEPVEEVKEGEKTETPPAPPAEKSESSAAAAVVVTEVVEAVAVVVDDDGTKTVEAIEETIVAVQPSKETEEVSASASASEPIIESKEEKTPPVDVEEETPRPPEEVFIWGIPLLGDERSDVILLKFLRARDFKVKDAFTMIKNTVRWRKEFGIDGLLEEDLGTDLEKVVFTSGFDKEDHPVCYNVYGEFQNKELYHKTFGDVEKSQKFLRWRIQFLEKSIQKLDFSPNGICTIVQVNDLKNSPGPFKRELRIATNQALSLLQDNYPEFVAKQIFINVPWWYLAFNRMISPFLTQRTRSKFVFAGLSKSAETLFKYIAPEQVPVQYGGLSKEGDHEFSTADLATEVTIKPATKQIVELPVSEACLLVWEIRVIGWDVSYSAEFVPSTEDGYTVIVQKTRKIAPSDEPVICNSFKISEPGKVVLTIDNLTSKKKKLLYRNKAKLATD